MRKFLRSLILFCQLFLVGCITSSSPSEQQPSYQPAKSITTPTIKTQQIALLLPLSGTLGHAGQAVKNGFLLGHYGNNQNKNRNIAIYDTTAQDIQTVYQKAVKNGAEFIVGPLDKHQVNTLATIPTFPVPVLALNYRVTPTESPQKSFYEFGLSPADETQQIANIAYQAGYKTALVIAPTGSWAENLVRIFQRQWQTNGGNINDQFYYDSAQELDQRIQDIARSNNDVQMIFLLASPEFARRIKPLLDRYFRKNIPVYAISYSYSGTPSPQQDKDINDIYFLEMPWGLNFQALKPLRDQVMQLWPQLYKEQPRLFALGLDAYHLVIAISNTQMSPGKTMRGATGLLSMDEKNQIHRQLELAQIRVGLPLLIDN